MNKKTFIITVLFLIMAAYSMIPRQCDAFYLFDEKLRVKGSIYEFLIYRTNIPDEERDYRDKDWGLMRTKGTLELLYKTVESEKLDVNLFGFFQYWHDSVPDIDQEYRDSIYDTKSYQGPFFHEDDWINELYADVYAGNWNIRLGKQIVVWSEVAMVRTIDQVNSLDLRYTNPGIDPWDEMKMGLWMMRGFYNSTLPGQLVFEWIWVPGDFEQIRTPTEGTSMAGGKVDPPSPKDSRYGRPRALGMKGLADEVFDDSRPSFKISNSQFGFRIRGNSEVSMLGDYYLLDWTVSWWHGMRSTPVVKSDQVEALNTFFYKHAVSRVSGNPFPPKPDQDLMEYKFYDAIGTSCQSYIPSLKGVLRGELSYEIGLPVNKTEDGTTFTGNSERDQMNAGVTFDRPVLIPWLQDRGWDVLDCSIGTFSQYKFGDVGRVRETFGWKDRTQTNFTLLIKSRFYHSEFRPVMNFLYNTRNWGYGAFVLAWLPTSHMRYSLGYMWIYATDPTDSSVASAENGDMIFFKIGYEF
jgi:hypothetical protein